MTLLIFAKSRDAVVLTADGRSNRRFSGQIVVSNDRLPKLFPHDSLPLAVGHHGENILDGVPICRNNVAPAGSIPPHGLNRDLVQSPRSCRAASASEPESNPSWWRRNSTEVMSASRTGRSTAASSNIENASSI
jgi:hypothetical protein